MNTNSNKDTLFGILMIIAILIILGFGISIGIGLILFLIKIGTFLIKIIFVGLIIYSIFAFIKWAINKI